MKLSKLILSFILSLTLFAQVSWAQMASTEAILTQSATASKEKIVQFMAREDVANRFEELGVNPQMIDQRLAAMTDIEVSQLAYQIDTLPAGGDASLVGSAVFIFIVLLITDILGLTKVFSFTR